MSRSRTKSLAAEMLEEQPSLREASAGSSLLDRLQRSAKRSEIDGETFYVVEGDLLLDDDQLAVYALQRETIDRARTLGLTAVTSEPQVAALVGIVHGGKILRWREGLVLTYCVLRGTFPNQAQYEVARDGVQQATAAWQAVCGITFEHRADLDGSLGTQNPGVVFTVRGFNSNGQFIAAAFFPDDPRNRRRVLIDPSYFASDLGFNRVGVLRHELGHVLGFRHEHIRSGAPPACPDEDLWGTVDLTQYDPQSVMHYFCGGAGSRELALTELDRIGSQKLYGPPFSSFTFVE